jgi:hypothetical protein
MLHLVLLSVMLMMILSPGFIDAFAHPLTTTSRRGSSSPYRLTDTKRHNFISDLWGEIIEFSTLGPGERKLLKARRAQASKKDDGEDLLSVEAFKAAAQRRKTDGISSEKLYDDSLSLEALQDVLATKKSSQAASPLDEFDGYALRDLLVERWGAPLDVGFQRGSLPTDGGFDVVYCSVLPVSFGSRKCQHETELDYLMHLQGVIEVLRKYGNNLALFVSHIETTDKTPKVGTDSVPFRLQLSEEQLERIL